MCLLLLFYCRPPSQHVSQIVWQQLHCSFARISINSPPQAGHAILQASCWSTSISWSPGVLHACPTASLATRVHDCGYGNQNGQSHWIATGQGRGDLQPTGYESQLRGVSGERLPSPNITPEPAPAQPPEPLRILPRGPLGHRLRLRIPPPARSEPKGPARNRRPRSLPKSTGPLAAMPFP